MSYLTDESRYNALKDREPIAEGQFIYCVTTTKIFCRPTCSSRLPLRENIVFCENIQKAFSMGYRPCKRCKPEQDVGWNNTRNIIEKSLVEIHRCVQQNMKFNIDDLIKDIEVSKWHFCRQFKNYVSMTPRKYYIECKKSGLSPKCVLPLIQTKKHLQRLKVEKAKDLSGSMKSELVTKKLKTSSFSTLSHFSDSPDIMNLSLWSDFDNLSDTCLNYIPDEVINEFNSSTFEEIYIYYTTLLKDLEISKPI